MILNTKIAQISQERGWALLGHDRSS